MRWCKHFIGTMRLHHLGSILSILLRMTEISAAVLGANTAGEKRDVIRHLFWAQKDVAPR